jgi:hypothetical protein
MYRSFENTTISTYCICLGSEILGNDVRIDPASIEPHLRTFVKIVMLTDHTTSIFPEMMGIHRSMSNMTPRILKLQMIILAANSIMSCFLALNSGHCADHRPRLAILTDIGGDPDDRQSLIRLMVYSNEFRIEALIASAAGTRGELKVSITRPELIHEIVDAYGQVRPSLAKHADNWPTVESLKSVIKSGNRFRQRAHIGEGHDTDASAHLIERIDAGTHEDRLNISVWGGQTDLAQSLRRVRADRGAQGLAEFVRKFRVYDIADQDGIAEWMQQEFPGMFYILSKAPKGRDGREAVFRGMYLTGDESLTSRDWIEANIRSTGPLGALYPTRTANAPNPHGCMKEGDTPSWFYFLKSGGNEIDDPSKPGWGGQFEKQPSGWYRDLTKKENYDPRATVSRWRPDFQADFAKRMSWCR